MDNKLTTIKDRVLQVAKHKGITYENFSREIGMTYGSFKGDAKNTPLNSDAIENILTIYLDVNADWLLTGRGEMLKSDDSDLYKDEQNKELVAMIADRGIPLIPLDAFAGFLADNSTQIMEYECEQYVIPNFKEAEFLIPVKGSSMYPKYSSGDIVACKKLPLDTFFQWNKVYVIDSEQGVLVKRIKKTNDPNKILLVSENKDYDPFELHRSEITSLALVIGVVRLE